MIKKLILCLFLGLGLVGFGGSQEDTFDQPIQLSDYCSCSAASKCGKTAARCEAACSGDREAVCDCVDPTEYRVCSAYGPYGSWRNSCRCR